MREPRPDRVTAIILAAGSGTRFGGPKQFAVVGARRLVDLVVETAASVCDDIVLVLPADVAWDGRPVTATVVGGPSRSASVRSGLAAVPPDDGIVVVHDPAHPLATRELFQAVIAAVRRGADAALPGLPLADPLKQVEGTRVVRTVPRAGIMLVQTPHAFRTAVLRAVRAGAVEVVEETVLVEEAGGTVVVVPGDPRNIHVTTVEELAMVARLLDDAPNAGPARFP